MLEESATGVSSLGSKGLVGAAVDGLICVNRYRKQYRNVDVEPMFVYGGTKSIRTGTNIPRPFPGAEQ
jgi:hypothetical protein